MIAAIDPVYGVIASAALGALPATIAAVRSSQVKRDVGTSNGHTNGEVVELVLNELRALRMIVEHHIKSPNAHEDITDLEKKS